MRHVLIAAAALVAFESAALACSCIATDDPTELKRLASEVAQDAAALVEVEVVRAYDHSSGEGEIMRVVRTIAGRAPATFQVPRTRFPSSASCDIEYRSGQRDELILYEVPSPAGVRLPTYRISGLCTDHLLDNPTFRNVVIQKIGGTDRPGERG